MKQEWTITGYQTSIPGPIKLTIRSGHIQKTIDVGGTLAAGILNETVRQGDVILIESTDDSQAITQT